MGLQTKALKFIGENLVEGAKAGIKQEGVKVAKKVAGLVLSSIGLGGLIDGDDDHAEEYHRETMAAIKSLGEQLDRIENQLKSMMKEMNEGFSMISQKLDEIHQHQLFAAWQNMDTRVQVYITNINTQYRVLINYALNAPNTSVKQVDGLVHEIINSNNGAANNMAQLNTLIVGNGGQSKGVLDLWQQMVAPLVLSNKMSFNDATNAYLKYYTSIVYAQMRAATLLVEAYNKLENPGVAEVNFKQYRAFAKAQELPFISFVDVFALNAINYAKTVQVHKDITKSVSMDALLARNSFFAGAAWGWTSPSDWHLEAETILANASGMGPDERRIVVWMIIRSEYAHTLTGKPVVNENKNFEICLSGSAVTRGIPESYYNKIERATPAVQEGSAPSHIKRSVWDSTTLGSTMPDGSYKLKDTNGDNPKITGYNGNVYFIHPDYLNYDVTIDRNEQFAFIEFAAYADPNKKYVWWRDSVA